MENHRNGKRGAGKEKTRVKGYRELALEALIQTMERDQYCDAVLHDLLAEHQELDRRDRAFINRLVEGTVERCIELDYVIERYTDITVRRMKPAVREILRMSVYQILYMDQVPDSAACNEAAKLAHSFHVVPLKGFINGVLRNVARYYEDIPYPKRQKNTAYHYSIWYSMPEWIVERFLEAYGEQETENILKAFLIEDRGVCVRCNTSLATREQILETFRAQNITAEQGKMFEDAFHIRGFGRIADVEAFQKGWIQVQDEHTMVVGAAADADENSVVVDVCAAPGSKTLQLADKMKGQGLIHACDISEKKVSLIRENLIRMGIHNVKLKKQDARECREEWMGTADVVVADLPCSGLGVIGHKPDIKYKTKPSDIQALVKKQQQILKQAWQYLKPGGMLLYSTCTITHEENEDQVAWILENLPLTSVSIEDKLPDMLQGQTGKEGYIQILPEETGGDGFFLAAFRYQGEENCQ